jgi:aerobic carbon-monoxide dehydrogenase large subunit
VIVAFLSRTTKVPTDATTTSEHIYCIQVSSTSAELISGRGRFIDDLVPDGTLHAAFARSHLAHAVIEGIDVGSRRADVVIHTAETLQAPSIPAQMRAGAPPAHGMARAPLANERVRYVGEPLAMVLAPSAATAEDATGDVWAELQPLPHVIDPDAAATDEVVIFPGAGTNIVNRSTRGAGDLPIPDAEIVVDLTIKHSRLAGVPMETLGILAIPGNGRVEIWCGSQQPHRLLRALNLVFGIEDSQLRVRVPDVGGAFGIKGPLYPEYVAVVAAALHHDRPVLWRERRREAFTGGVHGRGMQHRIRLAGQRDGTITAVRIDILGDLGAYPQSGFMIPETAAAIAAGPYRVEDVGVVVTSVVTNTAPTGPYRGAGRPEAAMAMERAVDEFARRLKREPARVRSQNLIRSTEMPYTSPTGLIYDGGDYGRALAMACDEIGLDEFRVRQQNRIEEGGDPIGLGFATFIEPAGGPASSGEYSAVEIDSTGTLVIRTGSTPAGQQHDRTWRGLVAPVFDVDDDQITVISGDTDEVPRGEGTFGSRSTQLTGVGLKLCSTRLVERARRLAAELLEANHEDLEVRQGAFAVVGSPQIRVTLAQIATHALAIGTELAETEFHSPGAQTFPYGTHAAEVSIDRDTGEVRIERLVAIDDAGKILDPRGADGQLWGGITQGVGQALLEGIRYSEEGQLLTSSLMDYSIPHATDIPPLVLGHIETPAPNALGAKGIGESGSVGIPAAVLNAVIDALAPYGVTDLTLPLHPARVWSAMQQASGTGNERSTTDNMDDHRPPFIANDAGRPSQHALKD